MGTTSAPAATVAPAASRLAGFWKSSIGKKIVMAASGVGGIGFVVVHMAGNLQMFKPGAGAQAMHDYAVGLRALGPLLWVARGALLLFVVVHVAAALQLTTRNRAARPIDYANRTPQVSTLAARTMRVGGLFLLLFIMFHIADMTWGIGHPNFTHLDPYNNLRLGFQRWWAVAVYLVAALCVGLHVYHGAWASMRTLGLRRPSDRPLHRTVATALALIIALGFAVVPIAAAAGFFPEDYPNVGEPRGTLATALPTPVRP